MEQVNCILTEIQSQFQFCLNWRCELVKHIFLKTNVEYNQFANDSIHIQTQVFVMHEFIGLVLHFLIDL